MPFSRPPVPKSMVRAAGEAIARRTAGLEEFEIVDQWRAAHAYVINTFQIWLKRRVTISGVAAEFAQRLKRRNTVIDKLRRSKPDGTPLIRDVTTMQDFAGCRLIFDDVNSLLNFRNYLLSSEVMENVNHKLKHPDRDKYNYIERPKVTGYRGIHDVLLHYPRPHRAGEDMAVSEPWHGLMVEVQYRTRAQHAWATALEISDIVDRERTKFGFGEDQRGVFFAMASEIIARRYEGMRKAFDQLSDSQLVDDFRRMEDDLGILQRLRALRQFDGYGRLRKHNVLNIFLQDDGGYGLEVEVFSNAEKAIERANELEASGDSLNAVYVTGEPAELRSAYRNYFNDPVDFVEMLPV